MKTPNYKETQGKHPIPHAKGIAKDESKSNNNDSKKSEKSKASNEEE